MKQGFVPSWCTACYRTGRTGAAFMKIAKKGDIKNFCHPNSLLTLQVQPCAAAEGFCAARHLTAGACAPHRAHAQEYIDDYAGPATKVRPAAHHAWRRRGLQKNNTGAAQELGKEVMEREAGTLDRPSVQRALERKLKKVKAGERDLYF